MDIHFPMMAASTCVVLYLLNLFLPLTIVIILSIIKICCKLTMGKCNSDQDMTGKTVLITGATSGVGKATALDLARRNARIILACRNVKLVKEVAEEITFLTGNTNIVIKMLDLTSFESVRKCADDILKTEKKLHVLINNAGTSESVVKLTKDGWETCIQVNHLSHFLLTLLLLDLLKKSSPSRIINVSSLIYLVTTLDITDLNATREGRFSLFRGNLYARTKIANLLFTRELARKLSGTGVTVNALHPGIVQTGLFRNMKYSIFGILAKLVTWLVGKTPEEGAQTTIYLAVHPEVENTTGKFFYDCKESLLFGRVNRKLAEDFFKLCERIVGVSCESIEKDSSLLQ